MIIFRLIHVLAGTCWVGAVVVVTWILIPAQRRAGPDGDGFVQHLANEGLTAWSLGLAMFLNTVSGVGLFLGRALDNSEWLMTRSGMALTIASILAVCGNAIFFWAGSRSRREFRELRAIVQASGGGATSSHMATRDALRAKTEKRLQLSAASLLIATGIMAIGQYL